jgi:hypothetical protein
MRTTKRFTPKVIARFERQGRGTGTYAEYRPWHGVSRGDPASLGRSHLLNWRGRLRELLSDGELGQQLFASMVPNLEDSLEQYKLSTEASPHLLAAYGIGSDSKLFPGTVELAKALGIKHPQVHGDGAVELWRASTDLVLVRRPPSEPHDALALAFKPADWRPTRREWELLRLEREFWVRRNVLWLLITPALYDERVVLTLRRTGCWALDADVPDDVRRWAAATARECPFDGLTRVLERVAIHTGSMESAQRAIWQAAWRGDLPVDLRRGWRPHAPLALLPISDYLALNPVVSRRSAWI